MCNVTLSLKYITFSVVDKNNVRIVATMLTVEHALKEAFECWCSCNTKDGCNRLGLGHAAEGWRNDQGDGRAIEGYTRM